MGKTHAAANLTLDTLLPAATNRYVGLASVVTNEDTPTLTEFTNITAPGYARVVTQFPAAAASQKANSAEILFPANSDPVADWPTPTHFIISDAAAAGVISYIVPIPGANQRIAEPGDQLRFPIGALVVTEG
jgi:hypothetical protein